MPASLTLFLLLLLFFCTSIDSLSAQTTKIVTHEGEEYIGDIASESADTIVIRSVSGVEVAVPRASIDKVDYSYSKSEEDAQGYWSFGGAFLTPGGINLVIGRHFTRSFGLRVAGGLIPGMAGVELDGVIRFAGSRKVDHSAILGVGTMVVDNHEWTFVQGGYNLNAYGFHLMLALSVGGGDFPNPQLLGQIGYVHLFR
jgi:hypothetical protein